MCVCVCLGGGGEAWGGGGEREEFTAVCTCQRVFLLSLSTAAITNPLTKS